MIYKSAILEEIKSLTFGVTDASFDQRLWNLGGESPWHFTQVPCLALGRAVGSESSW